MQLRQLEAHASLFRLCLVDAHLGELAGGTGLFLFPTIARNVRRGRGVLEQQVTRVETEQPPPALEGCADLRVDVRDETRKRRGQVSDILRAQQERRFDAI